MAEAINQGEVQPRISAVLRSRVGGMWFRLPALLLLSTALLLLPTGSTHPWEPEIRKTAVPAAGEPAACMSPQAQVSTAARAKDNFKSGINRRSALPSPSKEDSKHSLNFILLSSIWRNSQSAFHPRAIGCKVSLHLDPTGTSLLGYRFQTSWVPQRRFLGSPLAYQQSMLCYFQFCFCGKTIVKGLCAYRAVSSQLPRQALRTLACHIHL